MQKLVDTMAYRTLTDIPIVLASPRTALADNTSDFVT